MEDLEFTGERLTTVKNTEIKYHHLHRYALAIKLCSGKDVLDIASGEGYGSSLLSKKAKSVVGVDIDVDTVKFAKNKYRNKNLSFLEGSVTQIPLRDQSIDLIVSFETIEHHDQHEAMMKEFKRVLRPDGILIISSPDKLNYSDIPKFKNPFHVKELYEKEFQDLMNTYFQETQFFNQNMVYGSLIVKSDSSGNGFSEFSGDFDAINEKNTISIPMYNLCVASDVVVDLSNYPKNSLFDAGELFQTIISKEQEIYNSKTYRLGKFFTYPLRLFRKH